MYQLQRAPLLWRLEHIPHTSRLIEFPLIEKVARNVLAATATEASCERVFSRAKAISDAAPGLSREALDAKITVQMNMELVRARLDTITEPVCWRSFRGR